MTASKVLLLYPQKNFFREISLAGLASAEQLGPLDNFACK